MGKKKVVPKTGKYLGSIAETLTVLSFGALIVSVFVWLYVITRDYDSPYDMSGLQAFSFVIYSIFSLISSFALQGFTYIVKAAIHYLDKKGDFDVEVNDKVNVSASECLNKVQY